MKERLLFLLFFSSIFISMNSKILLANKDIYPKRKSIKGLQPDGQSLEQIIGNAVHGVAFNFVWANWQPSKTSSCSGGQIKYDGYCYNLDSNMIKQIRQYTNSGVVVTGVFYGVPGWAQRSCNNVHKIFCAPKDKYEVDYGRFVGFIANYFNGDNGNGRVADFVIHNEVNAAEWFNYGCSKGTCDVDTWTTVYSKSYNSAYDYARKEQKQAKVLISFEHCFGKELDSYLINDSPVCSVETFLKKLVPKLGSREWRLAFHSYPPNLLKPVFGPNDYPFITFGNIGVLAGWLRKNYPKKSHAWEIQLTENGINGKGAALYPVQEKMLCVAFRNILGTPGIESFIYHRLKDHPDETKQGLALGLWDENGKMKNAWTTFALANRKGVAKGYPKCGFENLPYIKITRAERDGFHMISSRNFPTGYKGEHSWKIYRNEKKETKMVYECRVGGKNGLQTLMTDYPDCEGLFPMGPLGYILTSKKENTVPLYRCYVNGNGDHFVSEDSNCEGQKVERLMGYVFK